MREYIGTKLIKAKPMNREEYNEYRGWDYPENEKGMEKDEGYLVEYINSINPNHPDHEGYISWSPKETFDDAYIVVNQMNFGLAIEAMRMGKKVRRMGWNGKGLHIGLHQVTEHSAMTNDFIYMDTTGLKTENIDLKMRIPWLASQADMLALDWVVIKD